MRWERRQASSRRPGPGPARDYAVPPTLRRLSTAGSAKTTRTTAVPTPIRTSTASAAGRPSARPLGGSNGPVATTAAGVVVCSGPGGEPATDGATPGVGLVPGADGGLPGGTANALGAWCLRGEGATSGLVLVAADVGCGAGEGDGDGG